MLKIFSKSAKLNISKTDLETLLSISKKDNKPLDEVLSNAIKFYSLDHFYNDIVKNGL